MITATCPVCNGTGRIQAPDNRYKQITAGYDQATDTVPCGNCGGQTMSLRGTGKVPLRPDGTPCVHQYTSQTTGRCLTTYTCVYCDYRFDIDSGD